MASLSSILTTVLSPFSSSSGLAELKTVLSGFVIHPFLSPITLLVKLAAMPLAVASGMMVGKEEGMVHVAACVGWVAAGISVAFGAPLGGVLFSLEECSTFFTSDTMWRSFFCAAVGAAFVKLLDPFRTGKIALIDYEFDRPWLPFELLFFVTIGVFGGLFGGFFNHMCVRMQAWRDAGGDFLSQQGWFGGLGIPIASSVTAPDNVSTRASESSQPSSSNRPRMSTGMITDDDLALFSVDPAPASFDQFLQVMLRPLSSRFDTTRIRYHVRHAAEAATIAACTVGLGWAFDLTRIDNLTLLDLLVRECPDLPDDKNLSSLCDSERQTRAAVLLVLAVVLKTFATVVAFGVMIPGGVYVPCLAVGACFGRMVGIAVEGLRGWTSESAFWAGCGEGVCVTPGTYALLGAMAFLGGSSRLTLSLTVIMFELTGQLSLIVPTMVVLTVAKSVATLTLNSPLGLSDAVVRIRGYPYLDHKRDEVFGGKVRELMKPASELLVMDASGLTWKDVQGIMDSGRGGRDAVRGFPVVTRRPMRHSEGTSPPTSSNTAQMELIGFIYKTDILHGVANARKGGLSLEHDTQVLFWEDDSGKSHRRHRGDSGSGPRLGNSAGGWDSWDHRTHFNPETDSMSNPAVSPAVLNMSSHGDVEMNTLASERISSRVNSPENRANFGPLPNSLSSSSLMAETIVDPEIHPESPREQERPPDSPDPHFRAGRSTSPHRSILPQVGRILSLRQFVDTAPITLAPDTSIDTCADLFRKVGARIVMVEHRGHLVGVVTKKDVLRWVERTEKERGADNGF
ncbi:glycerol ethanol, ferric requiring protein [Gonapodya sp. JEL0774]|nr:glycerol ethanol, ferric requiring protein [Gonapodya sp. JEL0774]